MRRDKNSGERRPTGFSYRFDFREVGFLVFGRKICPACGGELIKSRVSELKLGADIPHGPEPIFRDNQLVESRMFAFSCPACNRTYSLAELSGKVE